MSTEIDRLVVNVEREDNGAVDSLERLASSLERLADRSENLKKVANGLKSLQTAISSLNKEKLNGLSKLTGVLTRLSGVGKLPALASFANGVLKLSQLESAQLDAFRANLQELIASLAHLDQSIQSDHLRTLISDLAALTRNAKAAGKALSGVQSRGAVGNKAPPQEPAGEMVSQAVNSAGAGLKSRLMDWFQGLELNTQSVLGRINQLLGALGKLGAMAKSAWGQSATAAGAFRTVLSGIGAEVTGTLSGVAGLGELIAGKLSGNAVLAADGMKRALSGLNSFLTGNVKQMAALSRALSGLVGKVSSVPFQLAAKGANALAKSLQGVVKQAASQALKRLPSTIAAVAHPMQTASGVFGALRDRLAQITGRFQQASRSSSAFHRGLLGQLGMTVYYQAMWSVIFRVTSGISESLTNLYYANSRFAASLDLCATESLYLRNSIAAALSPAINALAPVIAFVVDQFVDFINVINMLIATITGQSTWTRAVKTPATYADALDGVSSAAQDAGDATKGAQAAAEDYQKTILGFDQINKLNEAISSAGSGGAGGGGGGGGAGGAAIPDYASMFTTEQVDLSNSPLGSALADMIQQIKDCIAAGDWHGVGLALADGLNAVLGALDQWINGTFRPFGVRWAGRLGEILNGVIDGLDWELLGKTAADGLNAVADIVNTFFTTVRFDDLGQGFGRALNSAFRNLDAKLLGQAVANYLNAGIDTSLGLVRTLDWSRLGTQIGAGLRSYFQTLHMDAAAEALGRTLGGVVTAAVEALGQLDFVAFGEKIGTALNAFLSGYDLSSYHVGELLADAFNDAVLLLTGLLNEGVLTHLSAVLSQEVNDFLKQVNLEAGVRTFANALSHLCEAAVQFMKEVDWSLLGQRLANSLKIFFRSDFLGDLGQVFAQTLNSAITAASSFADSFSQDDWKALGDQVAQSLNDFFDAVDWAALGLTLYSLGEGLLTAAKEAVAEVDWFGIEQSVSDLLNNLNWSGLKTDFVQVALSVIRRAVEIGAKSFGSWLSQAFLGGIASLLLGIPKVGASLVDGLLFGIWGAIEGIAVWINNNVVQPIVTAVCDLFGIHSPSTVMAAIGGYLIDGLIEGVAGKVQAAIQPFSDIWSGISGVFSGVSGWFGETFGGAFQAARAAWSGAKGTFSGVKRNVEAGFTSLPGDIKQTFGSSFGKAQGAWGSAKSAFQTISNHTVSGFGSLGSDTKRKFSTAFSGAKGAWSSAKSAFTSISKNVVSGFNSLASSIRSKFSAAMSSVRNLGWKSLGSNILNGILSGMYNFGSKLKSWANRLLEKTESALWINSPSRLFRDKVGVFLGLGVAEGLEQSVPDVLQTVSGMAGAISDRFHRAETQLPLGFGLSGMDETLNQFANRVHDTFVGLADALERAVQLLAQSDTLGFGQDGTWQTKAMDQPPATDASAQQLGTQIAKAILSRMDPSAASGGAQTITVNVTLDGKAVGRSVVRYAIEEAKATGQLPWAAYT